MRRLFGFVLLVVLVGGGLWYWKGKELGFEPPRGLGEMGRKLEDVALAGKVKGALELNRRLAVHPIEAAVEEGVVTLRGRVPDAATVELAERVAAAVPGVSQVVNHLKADPALAAIAAEGSDGRSAGERLDDEALAVKVRLAFSLDRELEGSDLSVSVFRRQVTLGGEVSTSRQAERAEAIARDVPGVGEVVLASRVRGAAPPAPPAEATPEPARR
ncbi:MAG: BON domain-containing protein [Vicinamibacteria bacterium]|jgi:osmotically-inducible protein OsmY|nr:BON domain-containing protein [Vicinamibacteria bacterium]